MYLQLKCRFPGCGVGVLHPGGSPSWGVLHPGGLGVLHLGGWGFSILGGSPSGGFSIWGGSPSQGGVPCDLCHHAFDVTCMLPPHQLRHINSAPAYILLPGHVTCKGMLGNPHPPCEQNDRQV